MDELNVPQHLLPLEEKIFIFFKDQVLFSASEVKRKFPDEGEKAIYRALNKLETTQRIRFAHWANRRKVYTTSGVSGLPVLRMANGESQPISVLLKYAADIHDEHGRFKSLHDLDLMMITMAQLFVFAQDDNPKEMKKQFMAAHDRLIEMQALMRRLSENIDALIKHPSMSGDMDAFSRTFTDPTDKAVPTAEEINKFRTWLAKLQK